MMHPPVHLCFSTLELRPTSNARIMLQHTLRSGEDTLLHMHGVSHTHRKTHTDYSSPTLPQCSQTFMSVGLYLFPTLDVQSAASGSVAADRVSLRCSQAHQAFCFYSVWFHFVFRVMSFSCFESRSVQRDNLVEGEKKTSPLGVRLNRLRTTTGRGHSQAV